MRGEATPVSGPTVSGHSGEAWLAAPTSHPLGILMEGPAYDNHGSHVPSLLPNFQLP